MAARQLVETEVFPTDCDSYVACEDCSGTHDMLVWWQQARAAQALLCGMAAAATRHTTWLNYSMTELTSLASTDIAHSARAMLLQVRAVDALARGQARDAAALADAAVREEALLGTPCYQLPLDPVKPSAELCGDVHTRLGRPATALACYEAALQLFPVRRLSLRGAARACSALGNVTCARHFYGQLASLLDPEAADAEEARAYLAAATWRPHAAPAVGGGWDGSFLAAMGTLALLVGGVMAWVCTTLWRVRRMLDPADRGRSTTQTRERAARADGSLRQRRSASVQ